MSTTPAIVVVGLRFGEQIARDLIRLDGRNAPRLVGVCDLDSNLARAVGRRQELPVYPDLEAVLADPAVEAVGLFVPPNVRTGLIRRITAAGRHIMTTKPFSLSSVDAGRALAEARAAGRVVLMNSPRLGPGAELGQLDLWRRRYDLGRPIGAQAQVWANYREQADGSWYDDPARCPVAPVLRLGSYLINDLVNLLGPVAQVNSVESRIFTRRPTSDNALLSLLFESGAVGSVFASFCIADGRPYQNALDLTFEGGRVWFRTVGTTAHQSTVAMFVESVADDGELIADHARALTPAYSYPWADFVRLIRSGETAPVELDQQILSGVRVLEMLADLDTPARLGVTA